MKRWKDHLTGTREQWYRRLLPLYGSWKVRQLEHRIQKEQQRIQRNFRICSCYFVAISVMFFGTILREPKAVDFDALLEKGGQVRLEYGGIQQGLYIPKAEVKDVERKDLAVLKEARSQISRVMLGNNSSWNHVSGSLIFPREWPPNMYLNYKSSDPFRIGKDGSVDGIGLNEGVPVTIEVTMILGNTMEQFTILCTVVPPETEEEVQQALALRARTLETLLNEKSENKSISLEEWIYPIRVIEEKPTGDLWVFMLLGIVMFVVIFLGRFRTVEEERRKRRQEISDQLPMIMDQLILMINAGLILSEALERTALMEVDQQEGHELREDLRVLCQRSKEVRRPVTILLCEYAVETGCSDLVRFSTMLADHVNRGSETLIQQLKLERNYALERQWKEKEGQSRQLGIKLTGPLLLLLSVILMVTIGPVMIGV